MKSFNITLYQAAAAGLALAGAGIIVLALLNSPLALQVALGFVGLGFIVLALVPLKLAQRETRDDERFGQLITRLDEITEELRRQAEKPGRSGVAIADIINSGMKFYSDYLNKDKEE